jgi:hypothetical protein
MQSTEEGTGIERVLWEAPRKVLHGAPRPRWREATRYNQQETSSQAGTGAPMKEPRKFCAQHQGRGIEKFSCGAPPRPKGKEEENPPRWREAITSNNQQERSPKARTDEQELHQ